MGITVLGPLEVAGSGTPLGARDRVVVAALAMGPGQTLTAEQLADAVWGAAPPASWRKNVQSCIVRLRRALGAGAIETTPHGYRLALPADDVDAAVFERLLARARELLTLGEPERAAYVLEQGLTLWRGRALPELEEWEPGRIEAARLGELHRDAEELWLEASLASGRHREVLARAQALVAAEPLRERRWRLLALAEYRCGRQSEALGTVRELRELLLREGGLDLDAETLELGEAILRQDPSLDVQPPGSGSGGSPYLGLSAYDVADADVFFGRDRDVRACLERLRTAGVLAVVGPSGLGKSSLVRAGIVPALRRQGCQVVVVSPGSRPLDCWPSGQAGREPGVVVVDQCEEVFTGCEDARARTRFLDLLVAHARAGSGPRLVVVLRAESMGDLAAHPAFARLVEQGLHLLGGMDEADLRAVIEGPARQSGLLVEPGLVDLLLREVEGEPAALPLLSHSLRETWLRREGGTLTVAGYRASGGIRQAVARTAEEVYDGLDPHQRDLLRQLLRRLVAPGPDGGAVLSRVPRRLVTADADQREIVDTLIASRILTSDEDAVWLTHEAIVRAWPRLRLWLDEDLDGRRILHHLAGAAEAWDVLDRPTSELYRGARLRQALDWVDRADPELAASERDFLAASRELAENEERSAEQRSREQSRLIRRLRTVLVGAVVLLLAATAATALAAQQRRVADRRAVEASAAETDAIARGAGAHALVSDNIDSSLLLAVAGVRLSDSVDTQRSLLAALGRYPQLAASTPLSGDRQVLQIDVSPDGDAVATIDDQNRVRLYAARTGVLLAERQVGEERTVASLRDRLLAFAPDGRTLAVVATGARHPVQLLDARTLDPSGPRLRSPLDGRWIGADLAFSHDGRHLAAGLRRTATEASTPNPSPTRAVALVWDLRGDRPPVKVRLGGSGWQSVALSPDGRTLYTSAPLLEHDLGSGATRRIGNASVTKLAMSPDGRMLAVISNGDVLMLDRRSGRLTPLDTSVDAGEVRFSANGRSLAVVEWNERQVEIWRVTGPGPTMTTSLDLDRGSAGAVDFSADDDYLLSTTGGTALRRWDLTGRHGFVHRDSAAGHRGDGLFAMVGPGGAQEVYVTGDGHRFAFHDLVTGRSTHEIPWGSGFRNSIGAWHPDGRHYATAVADRLRVWDLRTGRRVAAARLPGPRVSEIDYTPDGSRLLVAELSGRITALSTSTWRPVGPAVDVGERVSWIQAGPDGHSAVVLTGGPSGSADWLDSSDGWALVDLESGTVLRRGALGMAHGTWLGYSPDGRHAAVTGGSIAEQVDPTGTDGQLAVIDLRSGRLVRPPVTAHEGTAWQLAYSPDGSRILTSGLDGTVALWDADRGTLLGRVTIEGRPFVGAEFLPDGSAAQIVEWWTGRVWTWPLDPDSTVAFACRAAGRDLTRAEWRDEFGDLPYRQVCTA